MNRNIGCIIIMISFCFFASTSFFIVQKSAVFAQSIHSEVSQDNRGIKIDSNTISSLTDSPEVILQKFHEPSPDSKKWLGIWYFVACYIVQPKDNYYANVGQNVTIHTEIGRNQASDYFGNDIHTIHQWDVDAYELRTIPNGHSADYNVTSQIPGTVYVQDETQVMPKGPATNPGPIFSKVSAVHFTGETHNVEEMSVTADDDTFYVDDQEESEFKLTARAEFKPDNATDYRNIRWSLEKSSDNISIDVITGEITVKGNTPNLDFKVDAKVGNIISSKEFHVRKILTGPSHIYQGQTAYFSSHGPVIQELINNKNVNWWVINPEKGTPLMISAKMKNDVLVLNAFGAIHAIPTNTEYLLYATIGQKGDPDYRQITNKVSLNKIAGLPIVDGTQSVSLNPPSTNDKGDNTSLIDVGKDSKLIHSISLINNSDDLGNGSKVNKDGHLKLPISNNEIVDHVTQVSETSTTEKKLTLVERSPQKEGEYSIEDNNGQKVVNVFLKLDQDAQHEGIKETIDFYTVVDKIIDDSALYQPVYTIDDFDKDGYMYELLKNYISFKFGILTMTAPKYINYGPINCFFKGILNRISPDKNQNILTISDTRAEKKAGKLFLDFSNKFTNQSTKQDTRQLLIEYFDRDEHLHPSGPILMEDIPNGVSPYSIKWDLEQGLKVKSSGLPIPPGIYTSTVKWTYVESV